MNHTFDVAYWAPCPDHSAVRGSWCTIPGSVLPRQMSIDDILHYCRDHVVEKEVACVAVADVDAASVGIEMVHDIVHDVVADVMVSVAVESSYYHPQHILYAVVAAVGMDDYCYIDAAVEHDAWYYDVYHRLTCHDYTVICSPLQ